MGFERKAREEDYGVVGFGGGGEKYGVGGGERKKEGRRATTKPTFNEFFGNKLEMM